MENAGESLKWPKVLYTKMEFAMSVSPEAPSATKDPIYNRLEAWVKSANSGAPGGLKNLRQGSQTWTFIPTEKSLVKNAIVGIALAMAFSFVIVLLATRNIINTVLAILCVSMVILSITAYYAIRGYQFGTTESIAVVVLIGFSVDYIIHYSAEYMHSKEDTREDKMRQSLRQMGVSILGGFITTLGSGIFLLTAEFTFFYKFGETISLDRKSVV